LNNASTDSARNVIKKEFIGSPYILHHTTEHPQRKHIEKDVRQIGMQELVGQELIQVEVAGHEIVKAAEACQVNSPEL
jgi:hypothetical protein